MASSALSSSLYMSQRLPEPKATMETRAPVLPKTRVGMDESFVAALAAVMAAAVPMNSRRDRLMWNPSCPRSYQQSLADQMQHNSSTVRAFAVFENIQALPCSERKAAAVHRNRDAAIGQRRPYMRRHVIGTLDGMAVQAVVLGREPLEGIGQVLHDIGIGVLL